MLRLLPANCSLLLMVGKASISQWHSLDILGCARIGQNRTLFTLDVCTVSEQVVNFQDAQYVESGNESRCSSEVGGSDGTDTSQSLRENGRIKCLQNRGDKPLIPGINAPIV